MTYWPSGLCNCACNHEFGTDHEEDCTDDYCGYCDYYFIEDEMIYDE